MDERETTASDPVNLGRYEAPVLKRFGDMSLLTAGVKGGVKGDGPDSPGGPQTRIVS